MVVWTQYLQNVADFLNTTTQQAGIISALIVTIGMTLVIVIAIREKFGSVIVVPIFLFFSILFFVFIGWFPVWTGSVIALVLSMFVGYMFTRMTGMK